MASRWPTEKEFIGHVYVLSHIAFLKKLYWSFILWPLTLCFSGFCLYMFLQVCFLFIV